MKVVTSQEIREIDRRTIQEIGIPGMVLMENAGIAVFELIRRLTKNLPPSGLSVAVLAGKGNNGGDGFVVARHLFNSGYRVVIYLLAPPDDFTGDAATNLKIAQYLKIPTVLAVENDEMRITAEELDQFDLIVDAIFGTGLRGEIRGHAAEIIELANRARGIKIAVDLPSGINADTGAVAGVSFKADFTVTMGLPKAGLLLHPGADFCGEITVADIGFPPVAIEAQGIRTSLVTMDDALRRLPVRPPNGHKGTFGHVFVIAGSRGMTGAAALTSMAALRAGAGMATLGIPESLNEIMEVKLTEVMTLPLPETPSGAISSAAMPQIMAFAEKATVIALGPGLSRDPDTQNLVRRICFDIDKPMVIDADGINAIAGDPLVLSKLGINTVLTPHPGEMSRLTGRSIGEIESDRIGVARTFAVENGVVLVLKGAPTVTATPDGEVFINSTGNSGMATAGMGDVLTGLIAGIRAQGASAADAAVSAVYYHGAAADRLVSEKQMSPRGITAGDVLRTCGRMIGEMSDDS